MRGPATVLALAVVAALALGRVHPLLALVPLVFPGSVAVLVLLAVWRHGDPHDVTYQHRPER